jgi:phosphatidylglycerol lysyltransferase
MSYFYIRKFRATDMEEIKKTKTLLNSFKKRSTNFFSQNAKLIGSVILTITFFIIAIWFITQEQNELFQIKNSITEAKPLWILIGFLVTVLYIFLQGLMYVASFETIGAKITWKDATILFLKRNFISVFIPAGGITSLLFFTETLLKKGTTKAEVHLASAIYGFIGIVSVILFAIPLFLFALL